MDLLFKSRPFRVRYGRYAWRRNIKTAALIRHDNAGRAIRDMVPIGCNNVTYAHRDGSFANRRYPSLRCFATFGERMQFVVGPRLRAHPKGDPPLIGTRLRTNIHGRILTPTVHAMHPMN